MTTSTQQNDEGSSTMKSRLKKVFMVIGGFLGVIVLIIAGTALIQLDFSNDENLDVFIETKMAASDIRGLTAVFIENEDVTWSRNYGYADQENTKQVTDETIFQIASVSKTVTGVAIMQLYENGLIDLDSSINSYLPFEIINPNFPEQEITVRICQRQLEMPITFSSKPNITGCQTACGYAP
jgi:hypothetical protein